MLANRAGANKKRKKDVEAISFFLMYQFEWSITRVKDKKKSQGNHPVQTQRRVNS